VSDLQGPSALDELVMAWSIATAAQRAAFAAHIRPWLQRQPERRRIGRTPRPNQAAAKR